MGLSPAKYLLTKFSIEEIICKVNMDLGILKTLYRQLMVWKPLCRNSTLCTVLSNVLFSLLRMKTALSMALQLLSMRQQNKQRKYSSVQMA